jgi:hypothetical protein
MLVFRPGHGQAHGPSTALTAEIQKCDGHGFALPSERDVAEPRPCGLEVVRHGRNGQTGDMAADVLGLDGREEGPVGIGERHRVLQPALELLHEGRAQALIGEEVSDLAEDVTDVDVLEGFLVEARVEIGRCVLVLIDVGCIAHLHGGRILHGLRGWQDQSAAALPIPAVFTGRGFGFWGGDGEVILAVPFHRAHFGAGGVTEDGLLGVLMARFEEILADVPCQSCHVKPLSATLGVIGLATGHPVFEPVSRGWHTLPPALIPAMYIWRPPLPR